MKNIAPAIFRRMESAIRSRRTRRVLDWVHEIGKLTKPENIFWCDGSERENEFLIARIVETERADQAEREKSSALLFAPFEPERRRAGRAVHIHLHADQRRSRADKQLVGAGGNVFEAIWTAERRDARTHHVCHSLHHGPARFAPDQSRLRNHRFKIRRAQHANHDAHGRSRARSGSATIQRRNGTVACIRC